MVDRVARSGASLRHTCLSEFAEGAKERVTMKSGQGEFQARECQCKVLERE